MPGRPVFGMPPRASVTRAFAKSARDTMMSEPPRSSIVLMPACSNLSVYCCELSIGTPVAIGTHVGAPAHCAIAKINPAAATPTTMISARRGPPKRSKKDVKESGMSRLGHVYDCFVRIHQFVSQLDQHLQRD